MSLNKLIGCNTRNYLNSSKAIPKKATVVAETSILNLKGCFLMNLNN